MFLFLVIPLITYFLIMLKEGINKSIVYFNIKNIQKYTILVYTTSSYPCIAILNLISGAHENMTSKK